MPKDSIRVNLDAGSQEALARLSAITGVGRETIASRLLRGTLNALWITLDPITNGVASEEKAEAQTQSSDSGACHNDIGYWGPG